MEVEVQVPHQAPGEGLMVCEEIFTGLDDASPIFLLDLLKHRSGGVVQALDHSPAEAELWAPH